MIDEAIVSGDYITFKHVKTRKVVILEIEIAEENFQEVITKLGMPIGGESKPVAIALLKSNNFKYNAEQGEYHPNVINYGREITSTPEIPNVYNKEQTEGNKLRLRAVMLCKDKDFQRYIEVDHLNNTGHPITEERVTSYLKQWCEIDSRSELATNGNAQDAFKELIEKYINWQYEQQYSDNIGRIC